MLSKLVGIISYDIGSTHCKVNDIHEFNLNYVLSHDSHEPCKKFAFYNAP